MDSLDRDDRKPKKAEAKNELIKTRRTSRGQGKPFFFVCFLNSKDSAACCAMFVASRLPYLLKGMAFATALKLKKLNSEFAWTKKKQAVFSDVDFSLAQQEGQKMQMRTARPAEDSLNLFFFTLVHVHKIQ